MSLLEIYKTVSPLFFFKREGRLLIKEERKVEMNKKMIEDYAAIQEKYVQQQAEFTERKTEILIYKSQGNIERLKEIFSSNKSSEKGADDLKFNIIVKGTYTTTKYKMPVFSRIGGYLGKI